MFIVQVSQFYFLHPQAHRRVNTFGSHHVSGLNDDCTRTYLLVPTLKEQVTGVLLSYMKNESRDTNLFCSVYYKLLVNLLVCKGIFFCTKKYIYLFKYYRKLQTLSYHFKGSLLIPILQKSIVLEPFCKRLLHNCIGAISFNSSLSTLFCGRPLGSFARSTFLELSLNQWLNQ